MGHLGFTSSCADPDVWFRKLKQTTGEKYYEYILLYVDDVLVISDQADNVLQKEIGQYFVLHEESIGKLSNYLGGKLKLPLKMKLKLKLLAQLNTCSTCCLLLRMSRTI